jgi:hypothetical protein
MQLFIAGCLSILGRCSPFLVLNSRRAPLRFRIRFPASLTTEPKCGEDYGEIADYLFVEPEELRDGGHWIGKKEISP